MEASVIHQSSSRAHFVRPLIGSRNESIQVTWTSASVESATYVKETGRSRASHSSNAAYTSSTYVDVQSGRSDVGWIQTRIGRARRSGHRAREESRDNSISPMYVPAARRRSSR